MISNTCDTGEQRAREAEALQRGLEEIDEERRLLYVAITRAQERLFWVVRARLARPAAPLGIDHLDIPAAPLELTPEAEAEDG